MSNPHEHESKGSQNCGDSINIFCFLSTLENASAFRRDESFRNIAHMLHKNGKIKKCFEWLRF